MILKRLLPFLLCLLALYPAWVGASALEQRQGNEVHETVATTSHHCHDATTEKEAGAHTADMPSSCDTGNCLMHCLVPLVKPSIAIPEKPSTAYRATPAIGFSSISLETPSRPPSSL